MQNFICSRRHSSTSPRTFSTFARSVPAYSPPYFSIKGKPLSQNQFRFSVSSEWNSSTRRQDPIVSCCDQQGSM